MTTSYETIEYAVLNRVATITFNRPKEMNALNPKMRVETLTALKNAIADDEVRVIIFTGNGRSFGSGQDLSATEDMAMGAVKLIEEHLKPIIMEIHTSPKPVISAINGACAGVSAAIAMACDLSIMADDAFFYMAFAAVGLIPDGGSSWHLVNQLGYKRAYQMIAEAGRMPAAECLQLGLVNKVVAADSLVSEAQAWAEKLTKAAPLPLRYAKEALRAAMQTDLSGAITEEAKLQHFCFISEDCREAMTAFMQKRPPVFKGK